ncbi:MAG: sarcosine oxidase subunit gamma [Alphaproteobacteria bacterium]|nr:sarcosine oxidase subunit gamma [Alphaproteobacteria bacterium]
MASSALSAVRRPGVFGRNTAAPGVTLAERRGFHLMQVSALPGGEGALAAALKDRLGIALEARPNRAARGRDAVALWLGPQRWLVETKAAFDLALPAGQAAVVELDHARCVIRLSGPNARDVMAKGCLLDLHPRAFAAGACAQTNLFHSSALIHAVADDTFDVYVPRSFGQSFWEQLTDAAGEFGYRVE